MNTFNMAEIPMPINNMVLGRAYVPYQQYKDLFPVEEAITRGTIFKELYRPYHKQVQYFRRSEQ